MNIQQALQQAHQTLSAINGESADIDAQVLLTHVLQCNSAYLMTWPEKDLDEKQAALYLQLIQQRSEGLPVAHLTGQREFWSLNFSVDNSTLIPRPETETLVEFILEKFGDRKKLKLLDLGTGTGAIAIAIAITAVKALRRVVDPGFKSGNKAIDATIAAAGLRVCGRT